MGIRGEVFSTRVALQNRTYFFNVKENRMGDLYLNIVESKNKDSGGFERQSLVLFADDLQEFLSGFDESLRVMEKAVREKRRSTDSGRGGKAAPRGAARKADSGDAADFNDARPRGAAARLQGTTYKKRGGEPKAGSAGPGPKRASGKSREGRPKSGDAPREGRRVVVKKTPKDGGKKSRD